jgi:hypothetical protein
MPSSVTLLEHPQLWRRGARRTGERGLATGHAALDAALPGGGLPAQALTEILLPDPGHGEWTLLLPLLAWLERPVALVAPPLLPYPPALLRHGVDVARLLLIATRSERETLWAAEQCLRSGACAAVLAWLGEPSCRWRSAAEASKPAPFLAPGPRRETRAPQGERGRESVRGEEALRPAKPARRAVSNHPNHPALSQSLRRLQLACEAGRTPGLVFRDPVCAAQASPAALRLGLQAGEVEVLKCRGGHPGARVVLEA